MKVFENINSYKVSDKYIQIDKERDWRLESTYIKIDNKYKIKDKKTFSENFHFTNNSDYLLFGTNSSVYKIDEEVFYNIESYEISDYYGVISNGNKLCNLYDFSKKIELLKEWLPNNIYHIEGQYWCNDTEKDFKLIDVVKGEILWTIPQPEIEKPYDYTELTNVKKVLGIYNNILWVLLPDSRILGLDIFTGKVKEEIKNEYFLVHKDGISFDSISGNIVIFCFDLYIRFDLNTFIFSKELILPENIRISKSILYSCDKLSFIGRMNNSSEPNIYGIFNTNTLTFDFIGEQVVENGFFYQTPQVNKELFTVLDSEGNLIIHRIDEILSKYLMPKN